MERILYVGTYTGPGEGIYVCRMNTNTGAVSVDHAVKGVVNPSYLAVDGRRRFMYAVNEIDNYQGTSSGAVTALALDEQTGDLRVLNQQSSHGTAPCYLVVDRTNTYVLIANYGGGSVAVLPIRTDGTLGEATDTEQHHGSGPKTDRQAGPHAHSINLDAANQFAYTADLGIDRILIRRFDREHGRLLPASPSETVIKPGSGPRHLAFSPDGRKVYGTNELDGTVNVFSRNTASGALKLLQTLRTVPPDFKGENFPSGIRVSHDGRFVYCGNRGHNSIAVFTVTGKNGELSFVQCQSTQGDWPRDLVLDPAGRFLLVANQRSGSVASLSVDPMRGTLSPTGHVLAIPSAVCVHFL